MDILAEIYANTILMILSEALLVWCIYRSFSKRVYDRQKENFWFMLVSIIKKYGICPKSAMPETYQSSHTHAMNQILDLRLRRFAAESKKLADKPAQLKAAKAQCLKECYALLCDCFGIPPKQFTFEYRDSKKKYHAVANVTPKEFYEKYLRVDLDDYVGIINGPTADKPFHKMYTVKYLGNVVDGNPVSFLNLPMAEFKQAILNQMKAGNLVWFGCDCGKDGDRPAGLWDDQQYDYAGTLDMHLDMWTLICTTRACCRTC